VQRGLERRAALLGKKERVDDTVFSVRLGINGIGL
jgi:hypothetical protein